jgi:8-oxo-dGTP diphosphatase
MRNLAVKAFIIKENKILIIKRSDKDTEKPNTWEVPGGRLEENEDPILGLIRETKEETGLDIKVLEPITVRHFTRDDGIEITMTEYLCEPLTNDIKLSDEHSDYEWISIEKCKEKLIKHFHASIDKIK